MVDHNALSLPISPSEVIFSCSVCQKTLSDIYKDIGNSRGIRDGRSPNATVTTKLWLTECAHLTCGEHLEGGGAPFHPEGEQPRAPCPFCVAERNDDRPKNLYGVRGVQEGSYDPAIPRSWFESPPIKLDGNGPGMEALRFQYLQLIRYSTKMVERSRQAAQAQAETERTIEELLSSHQSLEDRAKELKTRVKALEKSDAKLRRWEQREPAIRHYLGIVSAIAKENDLLKEQLVTLGYEVPNTNYALQLADDKHLLNASRAGETKQSAVPGRPAPPEATNTPGMRHSDRTGRNIDRSSESHETTSSGRKRKHDEFTEQSHLEVKRPKSSRDLMPPPSLPITRRNNAQSLNPEYPQTVTDRDRGTLEYAASRSGASRNGKADLQVYEDGTWRSVSRPSQLEEGVSQIRLSSRREDSSSAYMSGALPAAQFRQRTTREASPPGPEPSRRVGAPFKPPTQTRASAEQSNQHDDIPFLKPLNRGPSASDINNRTQVRASFQQHPFKENLGRTRPDIAIDDRYAYAEAPRVPLQAYSSSSVNRGPLDRAAMNRYPLSERPSEPVYSGHLQLLSGDPPMSDNPTTPAPQRHLFSDAGSRQDSVASPFFKGTRANFYSSHSRQPSQLAHNYRMAPPAPPDWHEPRSLNGLSFITSPHNLNNEPIYSRDAPAYDNRQASQSFLVPPTPRNEAGLFRRPDMPPSTSQLQNHPSVFAAPPLAANDTYMRHVAPLPSSLPSTSVYPARTSTARTFNRDDALANIKGARSGPAGQPQRGSDMYRGGYTTRDSGYAGSRGLFSSTAGRRSVRR